MKTNKMSLVKIQGKISWAETKKSLFLVVLLSLFMLPGCKQANPITLHVTVTNDVCQSGQWVYWFSLNANEYNIEDSTYLPKGQHTFTMKKVIPDMNEEMGCWLTFSKHGPLQAYLILNKGENVKLTINKRGITKTEGSSATKIWYDYGHEILKVRSEMDSLAHVIVKTKDSITRKYLNNRLNSLSDSLQFKLKLDEFNKIKTPKMFLLQLSVPGLPRKTVDSLVKVMKHRFPNNKRVQEYPRHPKFPPPTPHSDWVRKRLLQIWNKRTGHSFSTRPIVGDTSSNSKVWVSVEKMPLYPGGTTALMIYLAKHIHYPEKAKKEGIHGVVFVNFIVEPDGSIDHVKILRGIGGGCDQEALNVVKNMPKWNPGTEKGKHVKVSFNLPVKFSLK